ncbi:hypothetical protein B0H14DRAFT_2653042 [Mycena olivaceomarginata]|nr:hypothetical protein B0H14DRAFT_2653042 [Mycena olivaceomarginata]
MHRWIDAAQERPRYWLRSDADHDDEAAGDTSDTTHVPHHPSAPDLRRPSSPPSVPLRPLASEPLFGVFHRAPAPPTPAPPRLNFFGLPFHTPQPAGVGSPPKRILTALAIGTPSAPPTSATPPAIPIIAAPSAIPTPSAPPVSTPVAPSRALPPAITSAVKSTGALLANASDASVLVGREHVGSLSLAPAPFKSAKSSVFAPTGAYPRIIHGYPFLFDLTCLDIFAFTVPEMSDFLQDLRTRDPASFLPKLETLQFSVSGSAEDFAAENESLPAVARFWRIPWRPDGAKTVWALD